MSTKHQLWTAIVGGAVTIGITVLLGPGGEIKSQIDLKSAAFHYCPKCERDWPNTKDRTSPTCPRCSAEMIGRAESLKDTGKPANPRARMFMLIYAELIVVMGLVLFITKRRAQVEEVEYLYMRCKACDQKLRYPESQIGQIGKCPRCKKPLLFPAESLAEEADVS